MIKSISTMLGLMIVSAAVTYGATILSFRFHDMTTAVQAQTVCGQHYAEAIPSFTTIPLLQKGDLAPLIAHAPTMPKRKPPVLNGDITNLNVAH